MHHYLGRGKETPAREEVRGGKKKDPLKIRQMDIYHCYLNCGNTEQFAYCNLGYIFLFFKNKQPLGNLIREYEKQKKHDIVTFLKGEIES